MNNAPYLQVSSRVITAKTLKSHNTTAKLTIVKPADGRLQEFSAFLYAPPEDCSVPAYGVYA